MSVFENERRMAMAGRAFGPADDRMATMRLLRRKSKAVAMTVVGH
jgi:hypothetical protein